MSQSLYVALGKRRLTQHYFHEAVSFGVGGEPIRTGALWALAFHLVLVCYHRVIIRGCSHR